MDNNCILKLENINKSFNRKPVITNFSYCFPGTGVIAVMGPSGCGKTTLLRMIAGLEKHDSGSIEKASETSIAYVFQENRLFPTLTAKENIECCCDNSEKAEILLEKVGLKEFADYLPAELSGGMKQRVSIARALSVNADIVLLDEAFKSQDEETREKLYDIIRDEAEKRLFIMVTHDIDEANKLAFETINL